MFHPRFSLLNGRAQEPFPEELSLPSLTKNLKHQSLTSNFREDFAEMPSNCENNNEFSENNTFSEATLEKNILIEKYSENNRPINQNSFQKEKDWI